MTGSLAPPYRTPSKEQAEIAAAILGPRRETHICGPYGSGKTGFATPVWLTWLTGTHTRKEAAVSCRSRDSFRALIQTEVEPWAKHHRVPFEKSGFGYYVGSNYLWQVIGSDAVSQERIKGRNLVGVLADEAVDLPPNLIYQLKSRTRVTEQRKMVFMTNPDEPSHSLKADHIDPILRGEADGQYFEMPLWANPVLPLSYVEDQCKLYSGPMFERYVLGRWVPGIGAVFPFLSNATGREPDTTPLAAGIGVDWGSSAPTHALLFHLHPGGVWWAAKEWRHAPKEGAGPMNSVDQAINIAEWAIREARAPIGPSVVDNREVAFKDILARELKARGHHVPFIHKGKQDQRTSARICDRRMVDGILKIDDQRCPKATSEMYGLTWDRLAFDRGEEDRPAPTLEKHGYDAFKYFVCDIIEEAVDYER